MELRVTAAKPQHLACRQFGVVKRAEADDFYTCPFQQLQVIRVVKIEGFIIGQGQG